MEDLTEKLGLKIDQIINLLYATDLNVPANIHLTALKSSLPEIANELIEIHSELGGENLWDDEPKLK